MDHHFRFSSFREKLIEHLFVGELLKLSWQSGDCSLEVAKPEVDNSGYDVIVERDGIVRHIQLKASHRDAKAASQKVHVALGRKPSGCVVWVRFDTSTLDLGPFLFFGGTAGNPLPNLGGFKVAKHTKADTQGIKAYRHHHRIVPKATFRLLATAEDVFHELFLRQPDCRTASVTSHALRAMERHFHQLISGRAAEFRLDMPALLPTIEPPFPTEATALWFPVSGMYGGFSYWLEDRREELTLVVDSWSRVLGGSGQRHEITEGRIALLEEGFV